MKARTPHPASPRVRGMAGLEGVGSQSGTLLLFVALAFLSVMFFLLAIHCLVGKVC